MNKRAKIISAVVVAAILLFFAIFFSADIWPDKVLDGHANSASFWLGFWANFISDSIVGLVLYVLLSQWLDKSKEYALELRTVARLRDRTNHSFKLRNTGVEAFLKEEIKWYLYVYCPGHASNDGYFKEPKDIDGKRYQLYAGILQIPIYPGEIEQLFSFFLGVNGGPRHGRVTGEVRYYFSTAHGLFPKTVQFAEDGSVKFESLAVMPLEFDLPA